MENLLPPGLYERLLDEELQQLLESNAELKPLLDTIDDESVPEVYAQWVEQVLRQALRIISPNDRLELVNRIMALLAAQDGLDYLKRKQLLSPRKNLLTGLVPTKTELSRPLTSLSTSTLLTGQGGDPSLEHELRAEMATADGVNMLVSFIKWSGLRLLMPALEQLAEKSVPVRIISTSYMGASDPSALEWLAGLRNVDIRLSYDTQATRLHAKAYHFRRASGFSSAYIGSANMSHSAMTHGLEWTVKVTAQDMPHILERFAAEFEVYWASRDFEPYDERSFQRFRQAVNRQREPSDVSQRFFAEITPRPYQLRILESLQAMRAAACRRNLVVAATGTGKTVIAALDYRQQMLEAGMAPSLLFVAHRKEILEQAIDCFRTVLRDQNFGELLVDGQQPAQWQHVFASIQSLGRQWHQLAPDHFAYVVVDEAHHGSADSYRPLFDHLRPGLLLGLTATPERMDGSSILPDFDGRMSAEIRLPEALHEQLLCPFHYFGVADNIDISGESFWRQGRYSVDALERVYTGDDIRARARVDLILKALQRYQPESDDIRGVGFCAGVKHAHFMTLHFQMAGLRAEMVTGETPRELRERHLSDLRAGRIHFVFTVDVLSEGVDIPEINLVLFLRPTESLTVFLQQLGRGLRHAPGKSALTVLDFVGQTHRRYRLDQRLAALLMGWRMGMKREVELDFPSLPSGCHIQLERVARARVLEKISLALRDLNTLIPELISTWHSEQQMPLSFGRFIEVSGLSALEVLKKHTWSEWKASALGQPVPDDPDVASLRAALVRIALRTDPEMLGILAGFSVDSDDSGLAMAMHCLRWQKPPAQLGMQHLHASTERWYRNPSIVADAREIAEWRLQHPTVPVRKIELPFDCFLKLHAAYGSAEIKSALGLVSATSLGPAGQGVIHVPEKKCYIHLLTFRKDDKAFSLTTRYRNYLISDRQLHWQSQSTITRQSVTGQNYLHFRERGYSVLFFARMERKVGWETAPFIYLGPAGRLLSAEGDRPISMVWELAYPVPAFLLEEAAVI